jgi:hypothetical protein
MAKLVEEWTDGFNFFSPQSRQGALINIPVILPRTLPKDSGRMCSLSGKNPEEAHKISRSGW